MEPMKNRIFGTMALAAALAASASAQDIVKMLDWDALGSKARESVNVNMDGPTLAMAQAFIDKTPLAGMAKKGGIDSERAKELVQKLKGVYVRVLEFDKPGEYDMAQVEALRSKLATMQFNALVDVREKGKETTGVFIKSDGKTVQGLVVLVAEPKELTLVHLVGDIAAADLEQLGAIPNVHLQGGAQKQATKKDE
jgi:hypothetical protein